MNPETKAGRRIDDDHSSIASRACSCLVNLYPLRKWPNTPAKLRRELGRGKLFVGCIRGYGVSVHNWIVKMSKSK